MDTREEIINAALELFSEKGFDSVSVRDVTQKASVNLASVSYHFGNKDGLIKEATSRILDPMNLKRTELLGKLLEEKNGIENVTLREIITIFLRPLILPEEHGGNPALLSKLGAKFANSNTTPLPEVSTTIYRDLLVNYVKAIMTKLPNEKPETIRTKLVFTSGAALQYMMLGRGAASLTGEQDDTPREVVLAGIVDFVLNGFNGAPEATTA